MTLSLTDKIVGFIVRPVETFREARDETVTDAGIYYLVLLVINAVLTAIVAYLGIGVARSSPPGIGTFIAGLIGAFIIGILLLALVSIFLHIGTRIMDGRGDFADSFKSVVYAQTPSMLLSWIPFIGFIVWIWSVVLLVLGVRELHEMDTMKAVIAVVIAVVIVVVIAAILGLILGAAFLALFGIASSSGAIPIDAVTVP